MLQLEEFNEQRQWAKLSGSFKGSRSETFNGKGDIVFVDGMDADQKQKMNMTLNTSSDDGMTRSGTYAERTQAKKK